jgi:hypothetical protein
VTAVNQVGERIYVPVFPLIEPAPQDQRLYFDKFETPDILPLLVNVEDLVFTRAVLLNRHQKINGVELCFHLNDFSHVIFDFGPAGPRC